MSQIKKTETCPLTKKLIKMMRQLLPILRKYSFNDSTNRYLTFAVYSDDSVKVYIDQTRINGGYINLFDDSKSQSELLTRFSEMQYYIHSFSYKDIKEHIANEMYSIRQLKAELLLEDDLAS